MTAAIKIFFFFIPTPPEPILSRHCPQSHGPRKENQTLAPGAGRSASCLQGPAGCQAGPLAADPFLCGLREDNAQTLTPGPVRTRDCIGVSPAVAVKIRELLGQNFRCRRRVHVYRALQTACVHTFSCTRSLCSVNFTCFFFFF